MLEHLQVGKRFPSWQAPLHGAYLSIIGTGLQLLVSCTPTAKDVSDFKTLAGYGLYSSPQFPHGLIIWQLGSNWFLDTPFDPKAERVLRPGPVATFLSGQANAMTRILIDYEGIVRSLNFAGLQWPFVKCLIKTWSNPSIDWASYNSLLSEVVKIPTVALWEEALTFPHNPTRR